MNKLRWITILIVGTLFLSACATATPLPPAASPTKGLPEETAPTDTVEPTEVPQPNDDAPIPPGAELEFATDFSIHSVPFTEILSGGPNRDGIPPLDDPVYINVSEADAWLADNEPVILITIDNTAHAYPLQVLMWHEIVNAMVGDVPVSVTFCPLCNTAIAFDRRFDDRVLDFGTTGRLRYSNLIMYDRQTETWWQQATGEGIVGEHTGELLTPIPASIIAWQDFRETYPEGDVLSRETGYNRPYGQNPYVGYDDVNNSPFLYDGPATPGQLPPMARVLTVEINGEAVAYPYEELQTANVIRDQVGGEDLVVLWQPGTASALDHGRIDQGEDVGTAAAFSAMLDGQRLDFTFDGERIVDTQTNSVWSVLGEALSGEFAGQHLEPVVSINHFWFSWAAFKPETRVYIGDSVSSEPATGESIESPELVNIPDSLLLDFEVVFYQSDFISETAKLSQVFANGKPTVLVFWAGLCPVCRREMPEIQVAYEQYGEQVNFIGIDVGMYTNLGSREDALALIDEFNLTYTMGATLDFNVMREYQITAIPTTMFMKPNGQILRKENTLLSEDALFERIDTLLESNES